MTAAEFKPENMRVKTITTGDQIISLGVTFVCFDQGIF